MKWGLCMHLVHLHPYLVNPKMLASKCRFSASEMFAKFVSMPPCTLQAFLLTGNKYAYFNIESALKHLAHLEHLEARHAISQLCLRHKIYCSPSLKPALLSSSYVSPCCDISCKINPMNCKSTSLLLFTL